LTTSTASSLTSAPVFNTFTSSRRGAEASDAFHGFKPYVGAGIQYIHFFKEGRGGIGRIRLDDAVGFTLQAGVDIELGDGWYLNADVKKTWIDTDASWKGTDITAKVDVDPWIYSVGIGYRFNLEDIFGHRYVEHAALK